VEAVIIIGGRFARNMQISRAHALMVPGRMMLCKVVCLVGGSVPPVDVKLSLADLVTDPVVSHIHGFGSFLFNHVIGDAGGGTVVGNHWGWRLWVAKLGKRDLFGNGFFAIVK
jgi:hypothetical protein